MLEFIPKTQWQLEREREYRAQRRAIWLSLLLLTIVASAIVLLGRDPDVIDLWRDILK